MICGWQGHAHRRSAGTSTARLQLQHAGAQFRAAYHSESKAQAARAKGIDAVVVDFNTPESLAPALAGVDKLFLLSGGAPNQVEQESNAVEAAKPTNARRKDGWFMAAGPCDRE